MVTVNEAAQAAFLAETGCTLAELLASPVGPSWAHVAHFAGRPLPSLIEAAESSEGPSLAEWTDALRAALAEAEDTEA